MLTSGQLTVGTTSIEVSGHNTQSVRLVVNNHEHGSGKLVWIGNAGVTPSNGMLLNGEPLSLTLNPMEHLHAVTNSGTVLIGYVRQTY
jgi:hypothetical protein